MLGLGLGLALVAVVGKAGIVARGLGAGGAALPAALPAARQALVQLQVGVGPDAELSKGAPRRQVLAPDLAEPNGVGLEAALVLQLGLELLGGVGALGLDGERRAAGRVLDEDAEGALRRSGGA